MTARIHHADLYGTRLRKHKWLNAHDVASTDWQNVQPTQPFYLFKPQDRSLWAEYETGWKLTEAMPLNGTGVITKRDFLSIHMTSEEVWRTVTKFAELSQADAREHFKLPKDVRDWHHDWAKADVLQSGPSQDCIKPILYRPFDIRRIYYTGRTRGFIGWPVVKVMRHMLEGENLGLVAARSNKSAVPDHFFCSRHIMETKCGESTTQSCLLPLYVYPDPEKVIEDTPWPEGAGGRRPNLAAGFVEQFAGTLGLAFVSDGRGDLKQTFGPEDIFHYAYAVFHAPTYRDRYAEFLKIDFPRLPLTSDAGLFATLCGLGAELVGLHLLERVPNPQAGYPADGNNTVTRTGRKAYKPPTDEAPGRVYINDAQYFEPVPPEVWGFHVGGYQVCEKWLKDRKARVLSYDDIETYRRITEAVRQTIRLMAEIDAAVPAWPLK
ncbi:MAG: helicase [Phycisphaerae bacterium]|nr:helicase [Phycisphaerae bacterium]